MKRISILALATFLSMISCVEARDPHEQMALRLSTLPEETQQLIYSLINLKPSYTLEKLSPNERWNIISHMFMNLYQSNEPSDLQEFWTEYLQVKDHTKTVFGLFYAPAAISHSLSNANAAAPITLLAHNANLRKTISALLEKVKTSEDASLGFWKEEKYPEKLLIDALYAHSNAATKTSPAWQEFFTCVRHSRPLFHAIFVTAGAVGGFYLTQKLRGKPLALPTKGQTQIITGAAVATTAFTCMPFLTAQEEFCKLLHYLHEKTNGIADVVHVLDRASTLAKKHSELRNLRYAYVFDALQKNSFSPKMNQLIALLRTDTFKGKPSFFSRRGRVRAAYALITDVRDELVPLFMALGELDAYVACARVQAQQHKV